MSRTLFVTGASSGIGRATARLFAARGWNVVATLRDTAKAADLAEDPAVLVQRLDVTDGPSIATAVEAGIARFGRIDLLVNNAGFGLFGLFETTPPERIREQFDVNLFGVMDVTRALLPHFRAQGGGTIVNVSSGAALFTLPLLSLYCASKFALDGFSEALAYELASQNVAVKLVVPHGGVTGTAFGERSAQERQAAAGLPDYDAFVERTAAAFARMTAARSLSAEEVAEAIFQAATDGSPRLRYLVGDDARGFVRARQELSDEDYVAFMRAQFAEG
ncbi:Short-chain dehydrogenase [Tistlia consotensis]|uniref:Short-chain dehydrogenase n=1 Tax=Tistlia consotensis USBA 355 TaxID=560819 RepID=A0A1Y6BQX6_9PROT|nr:SDR family oxidoreductase [Tistlia consotensis]SMF16491.1 Short-chain dehydrogenase [Tistlia consotensis USBA 355]SNR41109.1 Short-chain dehydrogenase [Tistlia consotensis]